MQGYATHVVVSQTSTVAVPNGMPWEQAGALAVSSQTADTALDALGLGPGDSLLLHAAAGGVGSAAVQLARRRGATVVGTASEGNHEYLRSLGATPVTYGPTVPEQVRAIGPVTHALDAIGGVALDQSLDLIGDPQRIITVADWERSSLLGIRRVGTDRSRERLAGIAAAVEQGDLRVEVAATFPLADAAVAHRLVETGHARGKVVLTVP